MKPENYKPHISERKKEEVKELLKLIKENPVIGIVNMENMPASQLQKLKSLLRGKVIVRMSKKRIIKKAFEQAENERKNIRELEKYLKGMPALLFSKENPFKLSKILTENISYAPAKPGQLAPEDIKIEKGKTPFSPGPIISELSSIGLKTGIEDGKIAIKEEKIIVRKGEKINERVASVLAKLGITPMRIGLEMIAAYENGEIFLPDTLSLTADKVSDMLRKVYVEGLNLALSIDYITKETAELLIVKAETQARSLALSANILTKESIINLIAESQSQAFALSEKIVKE
ncbi:MAG: 50S ribosomal protein L10 [Candidatus Woesearchaeota archaeon]